MPLFANRTRKASRLAIAAAMMSVGAFGLTAFDAPAYAQKAKYSNAFLKAFAPIDEAMKADSPDFAALRTQAEAARSTVSTDDDRYAFGSTLYAIGENLEDLALQREGMELMLQSGKVPEASVGSYTYAAGQLAYNLEDYAAARQRFEEALALGYEDPNARTLIAQTYSLEGDAAGGLQYIGQLINEQVQAGNAPSEELIKRGLTIAYNNDYYEDATNFSILLAENYPSATAWADAIAIQRNFGQYSEPELLDLLRLARTADAMREARDYIDYIDAANFRRLPAEVGAVAREGVAAGMLETGDAFVDEAISGAEERAPGLRADLGDLASDARASGAEASLAVAAGDAYLNFGEAANAAELYEIALTRSDVDRALALTRLGIAQVQAGDYAAAQETLGKVEGNRAPIARLWAAYASQQASGGMTPSA